MAQIEFYYEGRNITIQFNKYDTIGKIFQQFTSKAEVNPNSVSFLYDGKIIFNQNLNFEQIAIIYSIKKEINEYISQQFFIQSFFSIYICTMCWC